ncbi:MAG: NUDIX hydrolase [Candidatus Gracilibacteria bacterium]
MKIKQSWYRISAKALIYNEKGEFLLCKEDNGTWDFPGGGLDHGEGIDICLKRELKEEMGLTVTSINNKPKYFITANKPISKTRPWIANIFYEVKVKDLNFIQSDECVEIGFFDIKMAGKLDTLINVKEFLKVINN